MMKQIEVFQEFIILMCHLSLFHYRELLFLFSGKHFLRFKKKEI